MIPVSDHELLQRIYQKLSKHDKSLFTQGELNLLLKITKVWLRELSENRE